MASEGIYKKSRREQVYDRLYAAVTAAESYKGKRLAPVKELAETFGTSVRTVQLALEQLEKEGYIQRRHGVGTFIARQSRPIVANDHVIVAMPMHSEVWGALASHVVRELQASGRLAISIDMEQPDAATLLHRAAQGNVNTFIIRGHRTFPFHLLDQPAFREKQIIGLEEWASDFAPPHLHQVLHDYAYGGTQLAEYLLNRGHRRVLVAAPPGSLSHLEEPDDLPCGASRGRAFIETWTQAGGTWAPLPMRVAGQSLSGMTCDLAALLDHLTEADPATAIFGYRDLEGWTLQSLLHRHRRDLLERVEIVGYGDTLWSRAARPPMTTVAYPIEDMAQWVRQIFETELVKNLPRACSRVMVRPQLVDRSRDAR